MCKINVISKSGFGGSLYFIGLIIILTSCIRTPEERSDRRTERRNERDSLRFAYLLKIHPNFIDTTTRIDTVEKKVIVKITIPAIIDTGTVDSLLTLYCNTPEDTTVIVPFDTNHIRVPNRKEQLKRLIYAECTPEKVIGSGQKLLIHGKDTVKVNFRGTPMGLELTIESINREINRNNTLVVPCPDCSLSIWQKLLQDWILWLIILFAGFLLGIYKRRR